jgi:hypothetical protein
MFPPIFVKKTHNTTQHNTTQQEEQPVMWNTQVHKWDHTLKINNRSHNNRSTVVSSTIILNI